MYHTINSSKHDSLSLSHTKGHQELVGFKREFDYEIDIFSKEQKNNKTNYGGIFQGERIDPKINNSDQLIHSLIDDSNRDNVKNLPESGQINRDLQDIVSPQVERRLELGSPSHQFLPYINSISNQRQQQQGIINGCGQSFQGLSVLESNNNLNMMSQNKFGFGDITSKTALEDQEQYALSNGQDVVTPHDLIQTSTNRQSLYKGTKNFNQQGVSQQIAFNDILSSPKAQDLNNYQNNPSDDTTQLQNMQFAQRNSRKFSLKNEHSCGIAGSTRLFNKHQTSSSNAGQQSEQHNLQKQEFKKNSIATLHTRHRHKQTNIYILAIFCLRVIKFAKNLFYYSKRQQFKLLNQMKIKIIGDSTSFFKYYYYSGQLKKKPSIFEVAKYRLKSLISIRNLNSLISRCLCCKTEIQLLPDFDEGSKAKVVWDAILLFIIIFNIFSSPLRHSFETYQNNFYTTHFQSIIFAMDILLQFKTFHYLAQVQFQDGVIDTWLKPQTNYNSPWTERYIISLYWSVITIITIGYGDITPKTLIERIYVILFTFIGCGLFAYCINVIGEQVREIGREKAIFKRKSAKLNKFMSLRGLNKDLQQKVRKYYEYLFNEQMNEDEEGANVFNNLTTLLKKQVWIDVYGKLLKQKQIFSTNFSNDFINMLSLKVKEKKFGPEEYIFVNGDSANYIFIIISGEVDQFLQRDTVGDQYQSFPKLHFISSFKKGEMFGQLEFFSQSKRKSTIKTKCVTSVAYLHYSDFIEALQSFELDREVYYQIKDQINMYKNYSNIDLKCPICSEYRHTTHECNSVNFILYREKLIETAKKSEIQVRKKDGSEVEKFLKSQKKYKNTNTLREMQTLKDIPLQFKSQIIDLRFRKKFNSLVNNLNVKSEGFMIIVDILAEQIKETLSKEEEETIIQSELYSSEIKEVNSQINEAEQGQNKQELQEISVSEDLEGQEGSSVPRENRGKSFSLAGHSSFSKQLSDLPIRIRNRDHSLSEKQIHIEVSAEQEESQQNMTTIHRDSRKCKSLVSQQKSSFKSIIQQDSDRRIELWKSSQLIDYSYALKQDVNLYLIPQSYVIDEFFKFPQDVINSVCGQNSKSVQFCGSPTKYQNPISATTQYNKQISSKSDNQYTQVSSSNSISPTLFQPPLSQINSLRHIDSQRNYNNINNLTNTNYSNTNSNNNQSPFPLSPIGTNFNHNNNNYNFSNHPNINPMNIIHTNTIYSASPSNINSQNNFNSFNSNNNSSFGNAVNALNSLPQQQQQQSDYNQIITNNPFAPQYSQQQSPYSNRLGAYGIYLPALQQLEPINELQSKEIISSSSDEDKSPTRRSQIGNKVQAPSAIRRRSKEPSINLHVKNQQKNDSQVIPGNNSQYIGSNKSIGNHHMEAISPQRIQQHISQESIQIQRGFSSEQESVNQEDNYQQMGNVRNRTSSQQHVQFAGEDEENPNNSGVSLNNQNTLQSFEQTQYNSNGSGKNKKNKRNSHKPSRFSNNQYIYNSFVSQGSMQNHSNNVFKLSTQSSLDMQKNIFQPKNNSQIYQHQLSNNMNNNFNQQQQQPLNQGSLNNFNNSNSLNNNFVANFQQQLLLANNGIYSSQQSWAYDPSSLYSKIMSRQSIQLRFKKDQDFCALIYKKRINLKGVDKVYEDIYSNFDAMRNYTNYFWHNNFSQIQMKDKDKFIRRKFQSTATTTKMRKASRTNETNIMRNTNRTSVQFHLSRANSNIMQQQTSLHTSNKPSLTSLYQFPPRLSEKVGLYNKTIQI